jgi:galactokinase
MRSVASSSTLPGFDLHIESYVPPGSGMSSSAALTVSLLRALRDLYALPFDDVELARIAQRAETEFVGAPIGMDQMACSLGRPREWLFLDTRWLAFERVTLPAAATLVVINSGVQHQPPAVSTPCGAASRSRPRTVDTLRDLDITAIPQIEKLPYPLAGRARHVVTENQRVHDTVRALRAQRSKSGRGTLFRIACLDARRLSGIYGRG